MVRYQSERGDSPIREVEFITTEKGNSLCVFYLSSGLDSNRARQWLATVEPQLRIEAEIPVHCGDALVARSSKSQRELLQCFADQGNAFILPPPAAKKFNYWAARGKLSIAGQVLQLASAYLRPQGIDSATAGFALSNLAANMSNIIFGGEEIKDHHQLQFLKNRISVHLASQVQDVAALPDVNDVRKTGRETTKKYNPVYAFMKRYSVTFGEVGLRLFGTLCMIFPLAQMKGALRELGKGDLRGALQKGYNHTDPATARVGIIYMIGKMFSLVATAPDPYNPKPRSWLGSMREKAFFRISSMIEGFAAGTLAYDRFRNRKISLKKLGVGERQYPDVLGGVGGMLFTSGFGVRLFAKYGERKVDMDELTAHTVDSLAVVPQEKMSQAIAETAAMLSGHFGEEKLPFSSVYARLAGDLKKYHNIDVLSAETPKPVAQAMHFPQYVAAPERIFAHQGLKKQEKLMVPPAHAYADKVAFSADPTVFSLN